MGFKKSSVVILLLLLIIPVNCKAETVSDLYSYYGKEYKSTPPEESLAVVQKYDAAKRYVAMYQYVASSTYDVKVLEDRIADLEKELSNIEDQLRNGYNLSLDTIYLLEDSFIAYTKDLEEAKKSLEAVEVDSSLSVPSEVPTYEEYLNAKKDIALYNTSEEIGNLAGLKYPVDSYLINEVTPTSLSLSVANGTSVSSLFNGTVVKNTLDSVTVKHGKGTYTLYSGLIDTYVKVGDSVYQGQSLGITGNKLLLKLKVDDDLVDISKLFEEV